MLKLNFAKLSNRIALCYRMMQSPELKKANFNIKQADILNIPKNLCIFAPHICVSITHKRIHLGEQLFTN